jgi:hypothetical protein
MARRMRWTFSSVSADTTTCSSSAAISSPAVAPPPALPWLVVMPSSVPCNESVELIYTRASTTQPNPSYTIDMRRFGGDHESAFHLVPNQPTRPQHQSTKKKREIEAERDLGSGRALTMAARMRLVLSLSASIPLTGSEAAAHKRREKEKEKKGKLVRLGNWSEFLLVSRLGRSEIWASTGLDWAVLQHGPDPAMQKILLYSFARRRVRTSDLVVNSHTL